VTTDYLLGLRNASRPETETIVDDLGISEKSVNRLMSDKLLSLSKFNEESAGKIDTRTLKYILDLLLSFDGLDTLLDAIRARTIPHEHCLGSGWEDSPVDWSFMREGSAYGDTAINDMLFEKIAHSMLDSFIQHVGEKSVKRWVVDRQKG